MNEQEIRELVLKLISETSDGDSLAAAIADRWHESLAITRKDAYMGGHSEGYRDGIRDGRDECRGTDE